MSIRVPSTKKRALTISEKLFVEEMTRLDDDRPRTATEAYRRAYNPKGVPTTVYNDASVVFNRPVVKAAIAVIEAKVESDRRRAARGTLQHIQAKLWDIANDPVARDSDKIAALKGLTSMQPKDASESSPNKDSAASKEELMSRLNAVLSDVPDSIEIVGGVVVEHDVEPDVDVDVDSDVEIEVDIVSIHDDTPDDDDEPEY
jgi:hypothetical protein